MDRFLHKESLMSGLGFRLLLSSYLTTENFTVCVVLPRIKLLVVPVDSILSVEFESGIFSEKLTINYVNHRNSFKVIALSTVKAADWRTAFEKLGVKITNGSS